MEFGRKVGKMGGLRGLVCAVRFGLGAGSSATGRVPVRKLPNRPKRPKGLWPPRAGRTRAVIGIPEKAGFRLAPTRTAA